MEVVLSPSSHRLLSTLVAQPPHSLKALPLSLVGDLSGLGDRTVRRHLKKLCALQLVKVTRPGRGHVYSFWIAPQCYQTVLMTNDRYHVA